MQCRLVVGKQQEVVHVAEVALDPQPLLDVMVEFAEVEVGEMLAGQVANRQALARGRIGRGMGDDAVEQIQQCLLLEQAPEQGAQHGMVDAGEKLADIAFEKIAMTAGEVPNPPDGGMGSLAAAAGVAVGNRPALKVWFQHGAEGVVDNPVTERRGADGPALGVAHLEGEEGTGLVNT